MDLSIVVPLCNEAENIGPLVDEIHEALAHSGRLYEIICVDDGSSDGTAERLEALADQDPALVVLVLRKRFGQTAALQAGIDCARGQTIALLDGDRQNDPADIPAMLERLGEGHDLVAGYRRQRQDAFLTRILPSKIANALIGRMTGVALRDHGCTLKVMTADVARSLRLYGEMHRFVAVLAHSTGARISEVDVKHRPRTNGQSKYGLGRVIRVMLDLLVVCFIQGYLARPMHVFGLGGLVSGFLGMCICAWLAFEKLVNQAPLADRPLLLLGILLIIVGVQLVSMGLMADLLARTYHESQGKQVYHLRSQWVGPGKRASDSQAQSSDDMPRAAHGVSTPPSP